VHIRRRTQATSKAHRKAKRLRDPSKRFIPWTIGCLSVSLALMQKEITGEPLAQKQKTSYDILSTAPTLVAVSWRQQP